MHGFVIVVRDREIVCGGGEGRGREGGEMDLDLSCCVCIILDLGDGWMASSGVCE